jgi:LysM repeat protein
MRLYLMQMNAIRVAVIAAIACFAPLAAANAQAPDETIESMATQRAGTSRYVVRPGDTLYSIARIAGVPVATILRLNPSLDPRYVSVGDVIFIPGDLVPIRRAQIALSPSAGPPGSEVEVRGRGFRPYARLRLLIGRTPYDMRAVGRVRADGRGRAVTFSELPPWARPGRNVHFALQTIDQTSRVVAAPFRVIARPSPSERLTVTGTLIGGGVECPLLRADSGRLYSLAGETGEFNRGDRVQVHGRLAEVSICQQGATIEVRRIVEAE